MRRDTSGHMSKCATCKKKHEEMLLREKQREIVGTMDEKRLQMRETMDDGEYKLLLERATVFKRILRLRIFLGI